MNTFPDITTTALLGQACGDAWAAAFEYHAEAPHYARLSLDEKRYFDANVDVKGGRPDPTRLPGVYTDDTQQALALLRCWGLAKDPLDANEVANRFKATLKLMAQNGGGRFGVHRGTGRNFRQAVRTGKPVDTAGLGAPMRIGPVVTLLPAPELVAPWVIRVSRVTTSNPVGLACAVIYAYACWRAAHPDYDGGADPLTGMVDGIPSNIWEVCVEAMRLMRDGDEEALLEFARSTELSNKEFSCAANGFALTGIPWVLYHGLKADTFEDALYGVCSSGGDTDTVAAMAGCLAAIRHGRDVIPEWMVRGIKGLDHLDDPTLWHPIKSERALVRPS